MKLTFTEEQEMLQNSVRKFFEKEVSTELVRGLQQSESDGHSKNLWKKIAQTGWLAIAIPEKYNGAGGTLLDLGIVYEEAGRVLLPTAFYSTIFSSLLIEEIGTEDQKATYLSSIADGETIASIAYMEPQAIHNPDCYTTVARKVNDRYYLSGVKSFVQNAHLADLLIVIARTENDNHKEGLTAFLIPPQATGVTIQPHQTFGKDKQGVVEFSEVELGEENVLGTSEGALQGLSLTLKKATALQTMEMVGGMQKVIKMTVEYVSERKQFGVPIGSFQAVQHHLANLATYRDGSQLLAYQAISLLSDGKPADREISIAKAYASESYKSITVMAHQLWGGMGYATESDLYLWSNRAKACELSFGTKDYHTRQIAKIIPALV
jgi:alkylation response protein AidB-like acyl-CoA dehydrogenase